MITGEKFKDIADYIYTPSVKYETDFNDFGNTLNVSKLKDGDIIYTHTMFVKQLFLVLRNVDKKLILVSHNCDTNVDDSFIIPDCIVKWYSQNVNTLNPKIESIPIGLENSRWFPQLRKKEKMIEKLKEPKEIRNLVYMNHNIGTHPDRSKVFDMFKDKSWVTSEQGCSFDQYLDNIYNHKFMICPQGNGIDTHRIWECLYMRAIPIEKGNLNNRFYTDLPICFVNQWDEVNEGFLNDWYKNTVFNWLIVEEMLTFEYWANKIKHESLLYTSKVSN